MSSLLKLILVLISFSSSSVSLFQNKQPQLPSPLPSPLPPSLPPLLSLRPLQFSFKLSMPINNKTSDDIEYYSMDDRMIINFMLK